MREPVAYVAVEPRARAVASVDIAGNMVFNEYGKLIADREGVSSEPNTPPWRCTYLPVHMLFMRRGALSSAQIRPSCPEAPEYDVFLFSFGTVHRDYFSWRRGKQNSRCALLFE
jgi:hypothetical protein